MNPLMPIADLEQDDFARRHIGPDADQIARMLACIGAQSLDQLIDETLPADIRLPADALARALPSPLGEAAALAELHALASRNVVMKSLIGLGYYGTRLPAVIQRNVLENPGWYTAYTPYQAEIAQGRLEALLNFQQLVMDLTGLPLANASLLDEATAAAEAMAMARRLSKVKSNAFFVAQDCLPQTLDVLRTRARYFGFELRLGRPEAAADQEVFGALFQYPGADGQIHDLAAPIAAVKAAGGLTIVAADMLALVLLKSPGALGADIALGSSQRFGIPMGAGGPHAAYFATRDEHKRQVPGRIIGVSLDARGKPALRMALQTREQHIRREKANSNICTSQVLLANLAGFYAVYHGPQGLARIAWRVQRLTSLLVTGLQAAGVRLLGESWFDTLQLALGERSAHVLQAAREAGYNLRRVSDEVLGLSLDELTTSADVVRLVELITGQPQALATLEAALQRVEAGVEASVAAGQAGAPAGIPPGLLRTDAILTHAVFNSHHSEHAMLRYLKRLQNKDLAMDHAMIPLGSCTMKLNATSEMLPLSWPQLAEVHPFAPAEQLAGTRAIVAELSEALRLITGFDAISMQPNSGAQGEYAGLVTIRRYQASRGEAARDVCLIPRSAHGTNPATAQMCGLEVVVVDCDEAGNVDIEDLRAKAMRHAARLSCLMLTYPSTHGVYEEGVREICRLIHEHGGQVYMDGANLNAQVGLTSPGLIGADVSHLNLHKTFAIPHGGGGPGMGPIGMKAHLAPFMPDHVLQPASGSGQAAVSAAPWGSALILPISWMYIRMLGGAGLKRATEIAILNANYIACRLAPHYPILYAGRQGRVAHECILDVRELKAATGISELDIAKRLMDYGFHAPTVSFPVAGTLMVEPTESEDLAELERFIAAMIGIREEIRQVESGQWPADDNPLKRAPHTQADVVCADVAWTRPYSREQAVFPLPFVRHNKFWPTVNRIDDVHGDRHLSCACVPIDDYL